MNKTNWGLCIIAWIAGVMVTALILEHQFGEAPCALCLMQRIWFMIAGGIVLAGVVHNPNLGIYPLLTIVSAAVGAGFAGRHVWLLNFAPKDILNSCNAPIEKLIDYGSSNAALQAMTFGTADCGNSGWSMLGLSLPIWSLVGFAVIIAGAIMQWRR